MESVRECKVQLKSNILGPILGLRFLPFLSIMPAGSQNQRLALCRRHISLERTQLKNKLLPSPWVCWHNLLQSVLLLTKCLQLLVWLGNNGCVCFLFFLTINTLSLDVSSELSETWWSVPAFASSSASSMSMLSEFSKSVIAFWRRNTLELWRIHGVGDMTWWLLTQRVCLANQAWWHYVCAPCKGDTCFTVQVHCSVPLVYVCTVHMVVEKLPQILAQPTWLVATIYIM